MDKCYKYDYGRIGCFLTSLVRYNMAKVMNPYKQHIHQINTDGFVCDIEIPELHLGEHLGNWKLTTGNIQIVNVNKKIWT